MPKGCSTGAKRKVYRLENGVWQWRVLVDGEAYKKLHYTEESLTRDGDDKIQLVVKVGDKNQNIIIIENITFNSKSEWRLNEFLKSAGICPGEGVNYNLTDKACIGLGGQCRTVNKEKNGYINTEIAEFLEAGEQKPESIPGLLMSQSASEAAQQVQNTDSEPVDMDDIPF